MIVADERRFGRTRSPAANRLALRGLRRQWLIAALIAVPACDDKGRRGLRRAPDSKLRPRLVCPGASNDGVTVVVFAVYYSAPVGYTEAGAIMETQRAKFADSENSPLRLTSILRGAVIGAAFLALLITSLFARDAAASSPSQAQSTIPPTGDQTDKAKFDLYLPQVVTADADISDDDRDGDCPTYSDAVFTSLPVVGPPVDHPPSVNADLNLGVRGYATVTVPLTLIDINGPTDSDPPQLANILATQGIPDLVQAFRVNEWNWLCQDGRGCRGDPITYPPVTLLALATEPGDPVHTPARKSEIHSGGYVALALYAEERRLTLAYTREDTPARGYVVHIEDICVDPELLRLYRELDSAGRSSLPAVHSQEQIGTAATTSLKAAIRDTGSFMDPRSRKDWWQRY